MCRPIPSEVRVLTRYCPPEASPTGVKHAERSWNIPEHSSKASSEASTGIGHAERSWNIPEHSSKASERLRHAKRSFNILESFLGSFHRYRAWGTFLEHSGTFLGRTDSDAHIPYCIFVPRTDAIPSFFFFSLLYLFFSFHGIGHTRQTAPHPVRSVKLSCLGPG